MKRFAVLATLGAALVVLAPSCGPSTPTRTPSASTRQPGPTTPVQTGFGGEERFCGQHPLRGEISYDGTSGNVSMHLGISGLPPDIAVLLNWLNNTVRGYVIGEFSTGPQGRPVPSSLRLYRPGERRGYQILLTTEATVPGVLGILWPCGPPPRAPAMTVDNPAVTVAPATGLGDGQSVRVEVTGFGVHGKVWLSECENAEDATSLGCGPARARQPFVLTDAHRSGSTEFIVRSSAPSKPLGTTGPRSCARSCVVVAAGGGGAWAVARVTFG